MAVLGTMYDVRNSSEKTISITPCEVSPPSLLSKVHINWIGDGAVFRCNLQKSSKCFCVLLAQSIFIHVLLIMLTYYYWFVAARSALNTTVHHTMWYLTNKEEHAVYHLIYSRMYM